MTPSELETAFRSLDPQHLFVQALQQVLDEAVSELTRDVALPNLPSEARHFNAGRLAHALDFRSVIQALRTPKALISGPARRVNSRLP